MKIHIFERCNPFSHRPGTRCLIPGTREVIQAYPAKINDERLTVQAPIEEWTLFQDLEQAKVKIRGLTPDGVFTREFSGQQPKSKAKLSFGVHKAQTMNKIVERADPAEFLPLWFALAQHYSEQAIVEGESLLHDIGTAERLHLHQAWKNLFLAGFSDWMIPQAVDTHFHGFSKPPIAQGDPFQLFSVGHALIRGMFVKWY